MKFEEKLINLRKEKMLSQEELAEKLNVTRQTISKWELGQSKPDMDKIKEMSTLFEVSIENLINDNMNVEKDNKMENKKPRKTIMYILVGLLVALAIALVVTFTGNNGEAKLNEDNKSGNFITAFFDMFFDVAEKGMEINENVMDKFDENQEQMQQQFQENVNQMTQNFDKEALNMKLEAFVGTKTKMFVAMALDEVNKNNKTNAEHKILVVYNDKETSGEDEIVAIKNSLEDFEKYEVSMDYDENGYVNKVTIKDIEK